MQDFSTWLSAVLSVLVMISAYLIQRFIGAVDKLKESIDVLNVDLAENKVHVATISDNVEKLEMKLDQIIFSRNKFRQKPKI